MARGRQHFTAHAMTTGSMWPSSGGEHTEAACARRAPYLFPKRKEIISVGTGRTPRGAQWYLTAAMKHQFDFRYTTGLFQIMYILKRPDPKIKAKPCIN